MRDNDVTSTLTDPHVQWEAEREALQAEIDAPVAMPDDQRPGDAEERLAALNRTEVELIAKIEQTPATTIEGALIQIESRDRSEIAAGLAGLPEDEIRAIEARQSAVETIRRLIQGDRHAQWVADWIETNERASEGYCAIVGNDPIPPEVQRDFDRCEELQALLTDTPPTTLAGVKAQLEYLYHYQCELGLVNEELVEKIIGLAIAFLETEAGP